MDVVELKEALDAAIVERDRLNGLIVSLEMRIKWLEAGGDNNGNGVIDNEAAT